MKAPPGAGDARRLAAERWRYTRDRRPRAFAPLACHAGPGGSWSTEWAAHRSHECAAPGFPAPRRSRRVWCAATRGVPAQARGQPASQACAPGVPPGPCPRATHGCAPALWVHGLPASGPGGAVRIAIVQPERDQDYLRTRRGHVPIEAGVAQWRCVTRYTGVDDAPDNTRIAGVQMGEQAIGPRIRRSPGSAGRDRIAQGCQRDSSGRRRSMRQNTPAVADT